MERQCELGECHQGVSYHGGVSGCELQLSEGLDLHYETVPGREEVQGAGGRVEEASPVEGGRVHPKHWQ